MTESTYFGAPWPSGICEDGTQVPTPVGEPCLDCEETLVEGDRGWFLFALDRGPVPVHRECGFRSISGSVGHLMRKCHCYGGTVEDPPGFTRREAAKLAWAWVQVYGMG